MSERGRPITPLGIPDEVSGAMERMTRNLRLRPVAGDSPNVTSEPRSVAQATSRVGSRSGSLGSNGRKMTPTVQYPGYRDMISRLQEEAAEGIQSRTRNVIEDQLTSPGLSAKDIEKEDWTCRQHGDDSEQFHDNDVQQENSRFFEGFNFDRKKPKMKYYAVRRGRQTGLFNDWESCEQQVEGFSNCEFKSFQNERDALDYLSEALMHNTAEYGESASAYPPAQPFSQSEPEEYRFRQARNDAVGPVPNTVLRRNVTQRRSQGRAKDRTSIGATSVPLEMLISRKLHQRDKDVEYLSEAQVATPPLHTFHERHHEDEVEPGIPADFDRLWRRKTQIDGKLIAALQAQDATTYRLLEAEQLDINSQIYAKVFVSTSAIRPSNTATNTNTTSSSTPYPSEGLGTVQGLTPAVQSFDRSWVTESKDHEPDWLYILKFMRHDSRGLSGPTCQLPC